MKRPPLGLQARALGWLAQREQSRSELRRKLLRAARFQLEGHLQLEVTKAAEPAASAVRGGTSADDPALEVEQLLDTLQANGLLCEKRFVESRVRVRAPALGTRRIEMELAQHGLKLASQPLQLLRESELQRATQLWRRKFAGPAEDPKARARQMRFLAGRGFSGDVIRRVVTAAAEPRGDDLSDDEPAEHRQRQPGKRGD